MMFKGSLAWLLLVVAFAAIAGGGCGGSGSSGGGGDDPQPQPQEEILIADDRTLDVENDLSGDMPPLFLIEGAGEPIVIRAAEKPELAPDTYPGPCALQVPAQVRGILRPPLVFPISGDVSAATDGDGESSYTIHDRDTFKARLSGGVRYSVEVSRNLGEPLGGFIPEIAIRGPNGEPISDDAHDIIVAAEPVENPSVVVRSFVPNEDGVWTFTLEDAGQRGKIQSAADIRSTAYILRLYREKGQGGEVGHPTRVILDADALSLRDLMTLRRAAHGVNVRGGMKFTQDPIDGGNFRSVLPRVRVDSANHSAVMRHIPRVTARRPVADANRTQLERLVDDVPFNSKMDNGRGFYATTGKSASIAIVPFELSGGIGEPASEYRSTFITTKEEHEQELGIKTEASFSTADSSLNASAEYSNGIKYGLTSTTLVVHYHKWDKTYKTPEEYAISEAALAELKAQGYDKWREKYGDYFVAGRRMGAQIDAYIAIMSESTEEIEHVKTAMSGKTPSLSGSEEFTKALKDAVSKSKVSVVIRKQGDVGLADHFSVVSYDLKDSGDIDDIMGQVQAFVEAAQKDTFKFVTLDVRMAGYAEASNAGDLIPKDIPVDPNCFVKIRDFVSEMLGLASYYNNIISIPDGNIRDANVTKAGWRSDYDKLMTSINSRLDEICSSTKNLDDYTAKIKDLSDKYRELSERWCFYRALMAAQTAEKNNNSFGTYGYKTFDISAAVAKNIPSNGYYYELHEKEWSTGRRTWQRTYEISINERYFCYRAFCGLRDDEYNGTCVNNSNPTVGHKKYDAHFEGCFDRDVKWSLEVQSFVCSDEEYPFVGL